MIGDDVTVAQVIAFLGALGGLLVLVRKAYLGGKRISDLLDDWFGERARPGVPERKGVMERLSDQDATLTEVRARIEPLATHVENHAEVIQRLEGITASSQHTAGHLVRVERLLMRHIRESRVWVSAVDTAAAERDFKMPPWPSLPDPEPDNPTDPPPNPGKTTP